MSATWWSQNAGNHHHSIIFQKNRYPWWG